MKRFKQHLTVLDTARRETDAALALVAPAPDKSDQVIALAWEILFDYLCAQRAQIKFEQIQAAAEVIYKLARGRPQLKASEAGAPAAAPAGPGASLPASIRADMERALALLG
jgi:hypothetical protein